MRLVYRSRLRHPLFPGLTISHAARAKGTVTALSGSPEQLLAAADRGVRASRFIFTLHRPDSPFLDQADRDILWNVFGVPIYALLLDPAGEIAGYECQAQTGLHFRFERPELAYMSSIFVDSTGHYVSMAATVEDSLCECGRPGHRLIPVPREEDQVLVSEDPVIQFRFRIAPERRRTAAKQLA